MTLRITCQIGSSRLSGRLGVHGAGCSQGPHAVRRLAVLSGCESGREVIYLGDDGRGLYHQPPARPASKSIVAALWRVPDKQTTELMGQFYLEILERRADLASALRQAQRKLLKRPPQPVTHIFGRRTTRQDAGSMTSRQETSARELH